uniref:Transposase n=1 Tax=Escherichia coli TaxID=562 RepID=A0A288W2L3_ECOLX|nr:hypothetical protein PMPNAOBH_00008 [Escherichia coli]
MLAERGVNVDHSTIYRWVQRYAPEMENGCAGTGVTLPIFARGTWMNLREVNGRGRICTGPSTAGAALSILSLLPS